MAEQAWLRPSGYYRWGPCPGSLDLEPTIPEIPSPYAERGTMLHSMAEAHLRAGTNTNPSADGNAQIIQTYLDHVRNESLGAELLIEQKLKLNEDLLGTADAIVFMQRVVEGRVVNTLKIIDLKTGAGVKVYAHNNGQLLIYMLLARFEWGSIFGPFSEYELHIVQPPLDHIDVWRFDNSVLDGFERDLMAVLDRIKAGDRRLVPGEDQCRFCRAKAVCRARADYNLALARADFAPPPTLTMAEIAALLPQIPQIESWCAALRGHALSEALKGVNVPGYKLVTGRSNRVWRHEAEAALALADAGIAIEQIWNKKIIGITAAEELLGKSNPVFREQTFKPQGAPTLVPEKDPRPTLEQSIGDDFRAV